MGFSISETVENRPLGLLLGKVVNNYDENHKGLVKVSLTAYSKDSATTDWIPVLSPMAGEKRGHYFLPETGDTVVVGFLDNDVNNPVVVGSLWSPADYPDNAVTEANTIKKIVCKSGIQIIFNEEEKKEEIQILTPKKASITLKDETETVQIQTPDGKNKIVLDGKNGLVSIESDSDIKLASKKISVKAKDAIELEANNISISAKNQIKTEAKSKLSAEAAQVDISAKGTLELKSSGISTLKGSLVKINE